MYLYVIYYIWKIKYANIRPKILDPFIHIEQLCCCIFYIYIIQYTHFIVLQYEYCCCVHCLNNGVLWPVSMYSDLDLKDSQHTFSTLADEIKFNNNHITLIRCNTL